MKFKTIVLLAACSINLFSQTSEKWGTIGSSVGDCLISKTESNLILTEPNGNQWDLKKKGDTYVYNANNITITAEYINYKLLKITQNKYGSAFGISSTNTSVYRLVKDMSSDLDKPSEILKEHGLIFRYTFNYGKIGEDYVPEYTKTYNAGKKFFIAGIEVQEKDMRSYTTDGGYNKDVMGYTYVSQIINPTNKIIKVTYSISGNAKYPNIEKTSFWDFSYDKYKTIDEFKSFSSQNFIVLKPQENYKDQIKVGVTKPIDLEFIVSKVEVLDAMWIQGLEAALKTQNNLAQINKYLSDEKASDWHQQLINQKEKIQKNQREQFHAKYMPFVKTSIKPKDALLYDKDFESEVIYTLSNTSDKPLSVIFTLCGNQKQSIVLKAGETHKAESSIKGITKEGLYVSIEEVNNEVPVTDRDGNTYKVVRIGNQVWMAENLKVTKYNDGTPITLVSDNTQWRNLISGAYCWYDNNEAQYKNSYGALYNWHVVNTGKLCPVGWHVPSDAEWEQLAKYLGGYDIAGGKLKEIETTQWNSPNTNATNETGFTALPGGHHDLDGYFDFHGKKGYWWTANTIEGLGSLYWYIKHDNCRLGSSYTNELYGLSIRCIKE